MIKSPYRIAFKNGCEADIIPLNHSPVAGSVVALFEYLTSVQKEKGVGIGTGGGEWFSGGVNLNGGRFVMERR